MVVERGEEGMNYSGLKRVLSLYESILSVERCKATPIPVGALGHDRSLYICFRSYPGGLFEKSSRSDPIGTRERGGKRLCLLLVEFWYSTVGTPVSEGRTRTR